MHINLQESDFGLVWVDTDSTKKTMRRSDWWTELMMMNLNMRKWSLTVWQHLQRRKSEIYADLSGPVFRYLKKDFKKNLSSFSYRNIIHKSLSFSYQDVIQKSIFYMWHFVFRYLRTSFKKYSHLFSYRNVIQKSILRMWYFACRCLKSAQKRNFPRVTLCSILKMHLNLENVVNLDKGILFEKIDDGLLREASFLIAF